jgi:hypothetical protein
VSAAAHVAVVAAVITAGTRQLVPRPSVELVRVHFTPARPPDAPPREARSASVLANAIARMLPSRVDLPRLAVRSPSPAVLPTIQLRSPGVPDVPRSGNGPAGGPIAALPYDLLGSGDDDGVWGGAEATMRVIASATPRYPDALRASGVEGTVLVQFVVRHGGPRQHGDGEGAAFDARHLHAGRAGRAAALSLSAGLGGGAASAGAGANAVRVPLEALIAAAHGSEKGAGYLVASPRAVPRAERARRRYS